MSGNEVFVVTKRENRSLYYSGLQNFEPLWVKERADAMLYASADDAQQTADAVKGVVSRF